MTKSEPVEALTRAQGAAGQPAEIAVNTTLKSMKRALSNSGRIEIRGFGSFKVKDYDGYSGRNPKTGEKVKVKPKKMSFFKLSKGLHERFNNEGKD